MNATASVRLSLCLWVSLVTAPARAGETPGSGIVGSPHDFTKAAGIVNAAESKTRTCIFCHFPHAANNRIKIGLAEVGWNQDPTQSFYWSNGTVTSGGTRLPTDLSTWNGPSKMCLSCHGSTAAITEIARRKVNGAVGDGDGAPVWARSENPNEGAVMRTAAPAQRGHWTAATGDLGGTHPIGVPYPYRGVPGTYNGITMGQSVDVREFVPVPLNVKLFAAARGRVLEGAEPGATGIECASCHDVHNEDVRDRWLLRDTQGQLCLDCHAK